MRSPEMENQELDYSGWESLLYVGDVQSAHFPKTEGGTHSQASIFWLKKAGNRAKTTGALEQFWNSWGSVRDELMLVVSGSMASWLLDNVINSYVGLYGHVARQIKLEPFSLYECEECFKARHLILSRYQLQGLRRATRLRPALDLRQLSEG